MIRTSVGAGQGGPLLLDHEQRKFRASGVLLSQPGVMWNETACERMTSNSSAPIFYL
jgi:hypothetical protein